MAKHFKRNHKIINKVIQTKVYPPDAFYVKLKGESFFQTRSPRDLSGRKDDLFLLAFRADHI